VIGHYIIELQQLSDVCFILEELCWVHLDSFTFLNHHCVVPDDSIGSVDVLHFFAEIPNRLLQSFLRLYKVVFSFIQVSVKLVELFRITCLDAWLFNWLVLFLRLCFFLVKNI